MWSKGLGYGTWDWDVLKKTKIAPKNKFNVI
jgi:hypothetical protein